VAPKGQSRTFVTFGMGARQMNSPTDVRRMELAISASPDMDVCSEKAFWLAGEITHLSKFPFREDTWLEAGHTIDTSLDFEERFGYKYFALWDLELSFQPTDMEDEVHFFALVPLYEEEREWIVNNNTFAFMYHLYDVYGDKMFCADLPREVCIPDWDDREQYEQVLMHGLQHIYQLLVVKHAVIQTASHNHITTDKLVDLVLVYIVGQVALFLQPEFLNK
jgi:hypothetical protein